MLERLVIWIDTPIADSFTCVILDDQYTILQPPAQQPLTQLSTLAHNRETILLLASEHVLLTQAELPITQRERLRKAFPFAVEERLASNIEDCHFALGERYGAKQTAAVIDRQLLSALITRFAEANIAVKQIIPDVLTIPVDLDQWHCVIDGERALVNLGQQAGFAIEANQLDTLLTLTLNESEQQPQKITVTLLADSQFSASVPVDIKHQNLPLLSFMAQQLPRTKTINLLQDAFKTARSRSALKKTWRVPILLTAVLVTVFLVGNIGQLLYLHNQQQRLTKNINTIYRDLFPQATSITSPKLRIEREYQRLAGGGNTDFLQLLAITGKQLKQDSHINLHSLNFRDNRLALAVQASSFQALQQFSSTLQHQGLHVEQRNAKTSGKLVKADIEVHQ